MSRKKQKPCRNGPSGWRCAGLLGGPDAGAGIWESLLPVAAGVPGIKLGLSNGVLIFAVYMLNIPTAFVLMVLKVVLSGLLFGGVNAMMYAFAGGLLSMVFMALLSRVKGVHPVMVSMVGGVAHNVGQVALAMVILSTPQPDVLYGGADDCGPDYRRGHRCGGQPCDEASAENPQITRQTERPGGLMAAGAF